MAFLGKGTSVEPLRLKMEQRENLWYVTFDGKALAYATERKGAIESAAALLRRQLRDPALTARMEFTGIHPSELLPSPASLTAPHPAGMIDFPEAKRRVIEQWLPFAEKRIGTTARVIDDQCVEYDWGWVIHWEPVDRDKGDPRFVNEYHFPYTVDRVTGLTGGSGGTYGIRRGIIELLQLRPPELCGPYPKGRRHWLAVIDEFEAAGAFTPRNPQTPSYTESSSSGEP